MIEKLRLPAEAENAVQALYSQDWVYHDDGECKRHLQILFPDQRDMPEGKRFPLILFIPGSAWHRQEMYNDVPQYAALARRGYVVAAMQYRESDMAPFPAQVEDVARALQFVPGIADNFRIDTRRIFLMGNSSGGHIAMMAALFNAHGLGEKLPPIAGVICESGSTDLLLCAKAPLPPWMKKRPSAVLLGVDRIEGHEELARRASCGMYITEDITLPPVLLIHAEHDPVVTVASSRTLHDQLAAAGHRVQYIELAGCSAHGGPVFWEGPVLDAVQAFCDGQNR